MSSESYGFPSSHVQIWELDHKEGWVPKNSCFWTVVLEKTLESPLDHKEMRAVNPKENQSWILIANTDAEAEPPVLWPPNAKNWLIRKDPDAGKDWRQEMDNREQDGWMALLTRRMWVWTSSGNLWWTGKPGLLQSLWLQGVGHDWVTELVLLYEKTWKQWHNHGHEHIRDTRLILYIIFNTERNQLLVGMFAYRSGKGKFQEKPGLSYTRK